METVLLFVKEITEKAKRKGGSIHEMFSEYDPKSTGLITFEAFRKVLANINCYLDDEKFDFITTPYSERGMFYYDLFLHDMANAKVDKTNKNITADELREFGAPLRDQGTDVAQILKMYDRQRTGRVDPAVFFRYVSNTPLSQRIAAEYENSATGEVEYRRLNDDVRAALAERPQRTPRSLQPPPFMREVARCIRSRGIDVNSQLMRFDRYHRGTVPIDVFMSEFASWGVSLAPPQIKELAQSFSTGSEFDYRLFADVINRESTPVERPRVQKPKIEASSVIPRIAAFIIDRRPPLKSQFEAQDIRRNGVIPSPRFGRVLQQSGLDISPDELSVVTQTFSTNGGVDYNAFLDNVMPKSAPPDATVVIDRLVAFLATRDIRIRPLLERNSNGRSAPFDSFAAALHAIGFDVRPAELNALRSALARGPNSHIDIDAVSDLVDPPAPPEPKKEVFDPLPRHSRDEDATKALDAMTKVNTIAERFQLDLLAEFRREDNNRNGLITPDSFIRVITNLPASLPPDDISALAAFYTSAGGLCSYEQFVADMKDFGGRRAQSADKEMTTMQVQPAVSAVDASVKKLKIFLMRAGITPEVVFRPYDNMGTGLIPCARMRPILEGCGFPGTAADYGILTDTFADLRIPEKFNYKKLCQAVNSVEIGKEEYATTKIDDFSGSAQLDEVTLALLVTLKEKLMERHKRVRQPFMGVRMQLMPLRDFRRCIESYGLVIKENDMQRILHAYKRNVQGDCDWNQFCKDVESANVLR